MTPLTRPGLLPQARRRLGLVAGLALALSLTPALAAADSTTPPKTPNPGRAAAKPTTATPKVTVDTSRLVDLPAWGNRAGRPGQLGLPRAGRAPLGLK